MPEQLEERVAYLEAEVARLKNKVENGASSRPWWEQIVGTFADNAADDEAMRLGREYRDSFRSSSPETINEQMYILDTDHLSVLDRGGVNTQRLLQRLASVSSSQVAASIISYDFGQISDLSIEDWA